MSDGDFQIEIDGRTVAANRGEMIIHVADREGIFILFCYHEKRPSRPTAECVWWK